MPAHPTLCGHCGAPLRAGSTSCPFCGVDLAGAPAAPAPQGGADADVLAALRGGNKIGAIKIFHQRNGGSLGDAKRAVDALEAKLGRHR